MLEKPVVIFDTNVLILPLSRSLNVFEGVREAIGTNYKPVVLSVILDELKLMASTGSLTQRRRAKFALELARKCDVVEVERRMGEAVDDVILRVAASNRWAVATNDRELRKKLREKGIPVLFLRAGKRLVLEP
ncbi:MAG: hypothetical protein QXQ28_03540 [Candidatus Nezhaarchaeales archaeon]